MRKSGRQIDPSPRMRVSSAWWMIDCLFNDVVTPFVFAITRTMIENYHALEL